MISKIETIDFGFRFRNPLVKISVAKVINVFNVFRKKLNWAENHNVQVIMLKSRNKVEKLIKQKTIDKKFIKLSVVFNSIE